MYNSVHNCISDAKIYIEELNWRLVLVRGYGKNAKAPICLGWPDFYPKLDWFKNIMEFHGDAGIGINLGASGLVDLEGDSIEAEQTLDDLCKGVEFPYYRSLRSKHRIFQAQDDVGFLDIKKLSIEYRTGRHQSVLPPSIMNGIKYDWTVSPFDCPPPPLPAAAIEFYNLHKDDPSNRHDRSPRSPTKKRWPYRDRLDYILCKFNLFNEAKGAGLEFVGNHPDENGNIPCYVPAVLRNGNEDEQPSGVFNTKNGVLRDFGTGKNHLFFRVMSSLTGEPWQDILAQFQAKAGKTSGRPHSRRISHPTDKLSSPERVPLAEARANLEAYYEEQLNRPASPKTLHVIKGPPGLGKTFSLCKQLGEKNVKSMILTLENKLASSHDNIINTIGGGKASRMPVLRETPCPHPSEYEATSRRGFKPSASYPCRKCPIGPTHCPYLLSFTAMENADQLCAAAIYHTHEDFYTSYGNENRPILVLDENCIDLLLEPLAYSVEKWQAWSEMIRGWKRPDDIASFLALTDWLSKTVADFLETMDEDGKKIKYMPFPVPEYLRIPSLKMKTSLVKWLNRSACKKENRHTVNLYRAALYLLTAPDAYVLLERIRTGDNEIVNVRFRKINPLPTNKEVFILDATVNEELIRTIAKGWDIKVWECPPIEQEGRVIQIMDYDVSRNRIKSEVAVHKDNNPSWLVQVLDFLLEHYGPSPIITFKNVISSQPNAEIDILGRLKHQDKISAKYNFPCRGHTFDDQTLIVMGTPYKDQGVIWELALALWGFSALPKTKYTRRNRENGYFIAGNMAYADKHLRPIEEFLVTSDLVQAVGRIRPIQNSGLVFVISNALLKDWDVEQFTAAELFDLKLPMRKDASETYDRYSEAVNKMLPSGKWIKNLEICEMIGTPIRTGSQYWNRFKVENRDKIEVEGPKIKIMG